MHAKSLYHVWLFGTPGTVARQAPRSMGFSRQSWSGFPRPPPGDLPDPGIQPTSLMSPALAGGFFTTKAIWEAWDELRQISNKSNGLQPQRDSVTLGWGLRNRAMETLPCLPFLDLTSPDWAIEPSEGKQSPFHSKSTSDSAALLKHWIERWGFESMCGFLRAPESSRCNSSRAPHSDGPRGPAKRQWEDCSPGMPVMKMRS